MLRAFRRSPATAAFVLACLCAGFVLTTGNLLGLSTLPVGVGVLCGAGLVLCAEGFRRRRRAIRAAARGRRRPAPTGLPGRRYDLAKDRSTDGQRWLM